MKFTKFTLACALSLAAIYRASADVTVHVVGSTAFRAATVNAIIDRMSGATCIYSDDGTSPNGANFCTIKGTWPNVSGTTTIECAWSGSVAGIQAVTGHAPTNPVFYPIGHNSGGTAISFSSTTISGSVATGGTAFNVAQSGSDATAPTQPEITMADNDQISTLYTSPHLQDTTVGVIPFAWVVSGSAPAGLTNVGPNSIKALFTSTGFLSAEVFTGNTADRAHTNQTDGVMMYAIGRDNLSGSRVNAFAESGVGIFSECDQFTMAAADTGITVTGNTVTDIVLDDRTNSVVGATDAGNGGENSGGTLADDVRYTTTSVADDSDGFVARPIAFLTYLGESDSYRAIAGSGSKVTGAGAVNARYVTYNGIAGFSGSFFNDVVSTTATNTTLSAAGSANPATAFVGVVAGQAIRGANIAADTVVVSVNTGANPNTLVMSIPATGTSTTAKATVSNLIATPVREGTYTMWGYEHIMWNSTTLGTTGDKFQVASQISTQIATGGFVNGSVNVSNVGDYFASGLANSAAMEVKRASVGGPIITTY